MALTITVAQLSEAVRLTVSGSPDVPYLAIVTRQRSVAESIIEDYANDDCPDDVKNEAAIRIVGYLLDAPTGRTPQDAFTHSGAKSLLSRWHDISTAKVGIS